MSGGHMAERCALFIILSKGEGILVTGATFAELDPSRPTFHLLQRLPRLGGDVVDLFRRRCPPRKRAHRL